VSTDLLFSIKAGEVYSVVAMLLCSRRTCRPCERYFVNLKYLIAARGNYLQNEAEKKENIESARAVTDV
jgi:hypothetical protein